MEAVHVEYSCGDYDRHGYCAHHHVPYYDHRDLSHVDSSDHHDHHGSHHKHHDRSHYYIRDYPYSGDLDRLEDYCNDCPR